MHDESIGGWIGEDLVLMTGHVLLQCYLMIFVEKD